MNSYVLCLYTDNVTLQIDGVLYLRILDPFKVCNSVFSTCYLGDNIEFIPPIKCLNTQRIKCIKQKLNLNYLHYFAVCNMTFTVIKAM